MLAPILHKRDSPAHAERIIVSREREREREREIELVDLCF
jgi:hypothetical protein